MRELVLNCPESQAEAWSDALLEAGALSVSVEDADGDTEHEQALFGEPGTEPEVLAWRRNRLVALLADGDDPAHLLAALDGLAGPAPATDDWFLRDVPDADWVRLTQSQFGPIVVGERIWIVPSWHRDDAGLPSVGARDGIVRIELDPGLAFGTGSHPTTHLCLEWLASHLQGGETVLDYGCGSGILAIAARLLGAGPTWGVDIDEQAVLATARNAAANRVDVQAAVEFLRICEKYGLLAPAPVTHPTSGVLVIPRSWNRDDWMRMFERHGPPPWPGRRSGLCGSANE